MSTPTHLELVIERLTFRGAGLGRAVHKDTEGADPRRWLVPKALVGERVLAEELEPPEGRRAGRTVLLEVLEAGHLPLRRGPADCAFDRVCRGCQLRHIHYPDRLQHKVDQWIAALGRQLPVTVEPSPAVAATQLQGYRSRARARWAEVDGDRRLTLSSMLGPRIPAAECVDHSPALREKIRALEGGQEVPGDYADDWIEIHEEPSEAGWSSAMPSHAALVESVLTAHLSEIGPHDGALEIGCGRGRHAATIAASSGRYLGIDKDRAAIEVASRLASTTVAFRVGRADRAPRRLAKHRFRADLAVLHPMRRGLDAPALGADLRLLGVRSVIHITPTVAALACDGAALIDGGWQLGSLTPIDTMPGSYHMMGISSWY